MDNDQALMRRVSGVVDQLKGVEKLVVSFDGSGDEGFVEGVAVTPKTIVLPDELARKIEHVCENLLEERHPGWEINEGSYGRFIFDFVKKTAFLDFKHRTVRYEDDSEYL